jgi:hypothetical protein
VLDEQMGSCDNVALNARACQYAQHSASSALAIVTISKRMKAEECRGF